MNYENINALLTLDLQFFAEPGESNPEPAEPTPNPEPNPEPSPEPAKTYTQDEINEMIAKRLERERKKFADYDEIKTKATEYEAQLEAQRQLELSEVEKAQEQARKFEEQLSQLTAQLEAERTKAQQQAIKNEFIKVATSANIAYIDDAIALADLSAVKIDEDGKVVGVDDVVSALVENKPFLVAKKQPQAIGTATNGGTQPSDKTAEQLLADAAEKARNGGIKERMAYAKLKKELGK